MARWDLACRVLPDVRPHAWVLTPGRAATSVIGQDSEPPEGMRAMTSLPQSPRTVPRGEQSWVHTRLLVERGFEEMLRHGFTLIAAGFGSFAIFDGLATSHDRAEVPRIFALASTAIGVIIILLAARHFQAMNAWADADEFSGEPAPVLPNERRPMYLATAAVVIGVISFISLLLLPG